MGAFVRFLLSLAYPILVTPLYLDWSRRQAEQQIDKMQEAVFNTPGAEAPLPPMVILAGVGVTTGYGLWSKLLGMRRGWGLLALILGAPVGIAIFALRQAEQGK